MHKEAALLHMIDFDFEALRANGEKAIYLLSDPRPDRLDCYVGQTNSARRFNEHMRSRTDDGQSAEAKALWINDLRTAGFGFNVDILEVCKNEDADSRERHWIGCFEHSAFHIVVNGLIDRAISAQLVNDNLLKELPRKKPFFLAKIADLREIWCYQLTHKPLPEGFRAGYRLLREKRVTPASKDEILRATEMPPAHHWAATMGHHNADLVRRGTAGLYMARNAVPDAGCSMTVTLTEYVQWALTARYNNPDEIRVEFCETHAASLAAADPAS